jgi:ABC-2 type transport system permease protein
MMLGPTLVKELRLLRRDPRALVRLIALPVVFIVLFGTMFRATEKKPEAARPVPVWIDPSVAIGERITAAIDASGRFRVERVDSADEVRRRVAGEIDDAGLILPAGFDPLSGGAPAELVIATGRIGSERAAVEGPLTGIVTAVVLGARLGKPPGAIVRSVSPPGVKEPLAGASAFQISVPNNAVLFGFFVALTCALSFAEERRAGTWRRLLSAPVAPWQLLGAKLLPYIALGTIQVGLLFAIGAFGFDMRIGGSLAALAVLTVGVATCATALGLLFAAVSTTEKQISSLGSVVILIMGLLSGCMFPRALMPHALQQIGLFMPHGWALDAYTTLLVRDGAGFADVARPIAAVYGFAAAFLIAGLRRFRFDP